MCPMHFSFDCKALVLMPINRPPSMALFAMTEKDGDTVSQRGGNSLEVEEEAPTFGRSGLLPIQLEPVLMGLLSN